MTSQRNPPDPSPAGIGDVIAPVVAQAGLDLEDVQLRPAGGRLLLRILVDTDGGVTLDAVAALSNAVSAALDDSGAMGERAYVLDVGSPGVDRPLSLLRHWRRNAGRLVRITAADGSTRTGRIVAAHGPADDAPPKTVSIDFDGTVADVDAGTLRRAVVQVEFTDAQPLED